MTARLNLATLFSRNSYLFALLLLVIALSVNFALQNNLFEPNVLNRNIRVFLPLMVLAAGQALVIITGGIDLSVGSMVSLCNALLVTAVTAESDAGGVVTGVALIFGAGIMAGALNGFAVAYLRLQPIVTTYATSFIYSGLALYILPRPGGALPRDITTFYRAPVTVFSETPILGDIPLMAQMPLAFVIIALIIALWSFARGTRFVQFMYATGDNPAAAYATGVPVSFVKFSSYIISGMFAALTALLLTMSLGSGSPVSGADMTLPSIVAVVLGGTRLSGGQGGIIGAMIGVLILRFIRNIISFGNVDTWSQPVIDALIILIALAAPGIIGWLTRAVQTWRIQREGA